jgi:hypothetical protein
MRGAAYQDAFLSGWIDRQLGDKIYRPLLLMQVCLTKPHGSTDLGEAIAQAGGQLIRRSAREMIGVWGGSGISHDEPRRVIATAGHLHEICDVGLQCMLHASVLPISKTDGAVVYDDIATALAELPCGSAVPEEVARAVILSETFRAVSGLRLTLLPISVSGSHAAPRAASLYILENQHAVEEELHAAGRLDLPCSGPVARMAQLDAFGDLKPLAQAAAIAGPPFSLELLARMLDLDPPRLQPALEAACAHDLFVAETAGHSTQYTFRDAQLQCAAYNAVPNEDRLRLQRKAARALQELTGEKLPGGPAAMAQRHQSACDATQSKRWFSKAAWQEIVEGSPSEAVVLLRKSLAQHDNANGGATAFSRALLQLLGVQLAVTRGNAADPVFDAYLQSINIPDETTRVAWGQEFRSMWLAQSCHIVKGEVRAAITIGNLLLSQTNKRSGVGAESAAGRRILIHRMHALALMLSGQLSEALTHYDYVVEHYRADQHAVLRFAYGSDQLALA